eukprot:m51a1_g9060 hypothetical protein (324) ;mRNA; r:67152-76179
MGKKGDVVKPVMQGKVEMVDPREGKGGRRAKAVMSLYTGPTKIALKIAGKSDELVLEAPFKPATNSLQLRLYKDFQTCLVIVPVAGGATADQWHNAISESLRMSGTPAQPQQRDQRCVHVVCPGGDVVLPVPLVGAAGVPATVSSVLDTVVNRSMQDIPMLYSLCWAATGKHAGEWCVTDGNLAESNKMLYETVPLMERIVASIEGDVVTMTFAAASAEQAEVAYREVSALLRAERLVSAEQRQGLADEVATVERLAEEQEASNHKAYHTAMWANRWNEAEAERLEQREALIAEQEAQIAELKMAIALALQRAFGVEGMPSAV